MAVAKQQAQKPRERNGKRRCEGEVGKHTKGIYTASPNGYGGYMEADACGEGMEDTALPFTRNGNTCHTGLHASQPTLKKASQKCWKGSAVSNFEASVCHV